MDSREFKKNVIDPLSTSVEGFPWLDIYHAYDDVHILSEEIIALERQLNLKVVFDEKAGEAERFQALKRDRLISVLLKSHYMIADVFVCRFIGALHGKESISMQTFVASESKWLVALSDAELLPAYCVSIYRNKLIAHYDTRRLGAHSTSADGVRTMTPLPSEFGINSSDADELLKLRDKYGPDSQHIAAIKNQFELLTALFYHIPLRTNGAVNPDRRTINAIAERGGCESLSASRIVEGLGVFCISIAKGASHSL